jgi:sugar (pentulose or hexulose) kinase
MQLQEWQQQGQQLLRQLIKQLAVKVSRVMAAAAQHGSWQ